MANEPRDPSEMDDDLNNPPNPPAEPPARKPAVPPHEEDPEATRAELQRTRAALAKANKEATDRRHRLEELEEAERQREQAKLSETDRLKQEKAAAAAKIADAERKAAEAQARLVQTRIDAAVERAAFAMGFEYPDLAPRLIERGRVTIDEETDRIEGVKEALDRLVKEKPGLLAVTRGGGSPPRDNGRRPAGGPARTDRDRKQELIDEMRASGNYT